jgi:hypothetical protein
MFKKIKNMFKRKKAQRNKQTANKRQKKKEEVEVNGEIVWTNYTPDNNNLTDKPYHKSPNVDISPENSNRDMSYTETNTSSSSYTSSNSSNYSSDSSSS